MNLGQGRLGLTWACVDFAQIGPTRFDRGLGILNPT